MFADRQRVAFAPEIAGERLFADDVLARLHRLDDHGSVQIGRRADVDDIELAVGDQVAKAAIRRRNLVPTGEFENMIAPRSDRPDFDIQAVNAPVRIHMQFRHKAAAGQTDPDLCHGGYLQWSVNGRKTGPCSRDEQRGCLRNEPVMIGSW